MKNFHIFVDNAIFQSYHYPRYHDDSLYIGALRANISYDDVSFSINGFKVEGTTDQEIQDYFRFAYKMFEVQSNRQIEMYGIPIFSSQINSLTEGHTIPEVVAWLKQHANDKDESFGSLKYFPIYGLDIISNFL